MHGNLDISHRQIGNLEAPPSQDVDRLTESIDAALVPIPEFDQDIMDLDFSTPRIPAKSPRYSISDSPCLLSSHRPSAQHSNIVSYPLGATRASTAPQSLIAQKCGPRLGSSVIYNARTWRATLHSGVCCGSPHHRKRLMPALSSRVRNTPRSYFRSVSVPWGHNVTHRIIVDAVRSEVRLPIS